MPGSPTFASTSLGSIPNCSSWSKTTRTKSSPTLRRGGHDPEKVYAAYKAAVEQRPADGHPGEDDQRLRSGRSGRRPQYRPQQQEAERAGIARVPHAVRHSDFRRSAQAPFYKPPEDSAEMRYLRERREALGGPCRADRRWHPDDWKRPRWMPLYRVSKLAVRRQGDVDHDGFVQRCSASCVATSKSASMWCRSCPTNRARSAWRACSAKSASIRTSASCTSRSIRTSSPNTKRRRTARFWKKASPKPARCQLQRRGHRLCIARREYDSVLHLLLDVRLPADWRSRSGRARHASQRLYARRHRGPHDAQRRRTAASGRP
jgi:hypothetical protein